MKIIVFIQTIAALCQTHVQASEERSISSVALADFSIKLHSAEITEIGDYISTLKSVTRNHMDEYLSKRISTKGQEEYNEITLTTKAFSTEQSETRLRKLSSKNYISTISYKGSISFKSISVPSADDVHQLQKEAFIGQAKLNFLSDIHDVSTAGDSLYTIEDAVFSFDSLVTTKETDKVDTETKDEPNITTTIIVGGAIGVSFVLSVVTIYLLFSRKKSKKFHACEGEPPSTMVDDKTTSNELRVDIPELQAASTGPLSTSPEDSSVSSSKFTYNNIQSDGAYSVSLNTRTETKSFNSGGTIDLSQVDVNAWRKNNMVDEEPFETDITKISETSPNKTMEMGPSSKSIQRSKENFQPDPPYVEIRINDNKRQSGGTYLSKDNLNQFDGNRRNTGFGAHSARYQERVYGRPHHAISRNSSRPIHRREHDVMNDLNALSQAINTKRSPDEN